MLKDLFFRLRSVFRRETVESEMEEELRFHSERQLEKYRNTGMSREEAQRRSPFDSRRCPTLGTCRSYHRLRSMWTTMRS